jgi:hypothetical protein
MKDEKGVSLLPRLTETQVHEMVEDFVRVEDMASDGVLGNMSKEESSFFLIMSAENSKIYTRIVANSILTALGYNPLYTYTSNDNPYPFVDQSFVNTLTSFFDRDNTDYGLDVDHEYEDESDIDE